MNGRLTTHVLDTSTGRPAMGVAIQLWLLDSDGGRRQLASAVTNEQGRTDEPLLDGDLQARSYELVFDVGSYFGPTNAGFLELVPVRFNVTDPAGHYHVPLLVSPWSYTTYRGS